MLEDELGHAPVLTIGKDTRISSDMLESALMAGICSVGGNVIPLGTIPTPAVAFLTVQEQADAGIVISASHNPFEHNGIKVFNSKGYKLPDETELKVEEKILSGVPMAEKKGTAIGRRLSGMRQLKKDYIHHLRSSIESDLSGLRILVDCACGAASATAPELFGLLNAHTEFIAVDPDGVNINDHCGSTHLDLLAEKVVAGGYDIGVAFDGDADRCLAVDEKGQLIDGDKIMAICALMLRGEGKLSNETVVATVMSNLGLHLFAKEHNMDLICTDVGDRNVLEKMLEGGYAIGGEQSGHMIFLEHATTGDGQLTALQLLRAVCGQKASVMAGVCASYPQVLLNVPLASKEQKTAIMASQELKVAITEEEERLQGNGRILVRPSGTEALIRVMVEAREEETAKSVAENLVEVVKKLS